MLNSATTTASPQLPGPPHYVDLHINPGESVSIQYFDGNETLLRGPQTIKMISQHLYPPMPLPVQVPPGHMIQQVVDENGTLKHIILSSLTTPSGGAAATLNASTSIISNPQHLQQYCCCCNNSCSGTPPQPPIPNVSSTVGASASTVTSTGTTGTHLAAAAFSNQIIHQTPGFSPLSHSQANTYSKNRRSTRNYPSPNKRPNYNNNSVNNNSNTNSYYNISPSGMTKGSVNTTRYTKISSSSPSQSDNSKSSPYSNRYNVSNNIGMHYDHHHNNNHNHHHRSSSSIYDQNTTTHNNINDLSNNKYLNHHNINSKSYDSYSYSSNNNISHQTSVTLDQLNDNLKYYKHDDYNKYDVDDGHHYYTSSKKASFNSLNFLADYTADVGDNDVDVLSLKSSLSESVDTNELSPNHNNHNDDDNEDVVVVDANSNLNKATKDVTSNRNNSTVTKISSSSLKHNDSKASKITTTSNSSNSNNSDQKPVTSNDKMDDHDNPTIKIKTNEGEKSDLESNKISETKIKDQKTSITTNNNLTQPIIILEETIDDDDNSVLLLETNSLLSDNNNVKTKDSDEDSPNIAEDNDDNDWSSMSSTNKNKKDNDNGKLSLANGHLVDHLLLDSPDSGSEQIETDKTESESDDNDNCNNGDNNQKIDQSVLSSSSDTSTQQQQQPQSRSPKHLLPKIESLTLICTAVTSNTAKLKWQFNNQQLAEHNSNSLEQQKRHYIVDLSLNNQSNDDTPSITRMAYQGPNTTCRVHNLQAQHEYTFRVRTSTETAWLVSNILNVSTPESTPSFNRSGRRTNKQLHHQVAQQQQLIIQQQQQLLQHQLMEQQEKQKQNSQLSLSSSTLSNDLLVNPVGVVVSTDEGYAFILVAGFTIISLIMAVIINHVLCNQW